MQALKPTILSLTMFESNNSKNERPKQFKQNCVFFKVLRPLRFLDCIGPFKFLKTKGYKLPTTSSQPKFPCELGKF